MKKIKKLVSQYALYTIMLIMIIAIAIMSHGKFLQFRVLRDILLQSASRIVVAMGCMFVIVAGQTDLAGGRITGICAVVAGTLAQSSTYSIKFWPNLPELPIIVPFIAAILLGTICGCASGLVVSKLNVPAFLATLGVQQIVYGANCLYFNKAPNKSQPLGGFLPYMSKFGTGFIAGVLPNLVVVALVVMLFVWILQTKTNLGKEIFAVGGNPEAARVSGINVFKIQMFVYGIAGACYGLAGVMEACRTGSASSTYCSDYAFDAIASCIVGGCAAGGGVGSVLGVFFGVIIFNVINYGLTFIGLSTYWQFVVKGLIIIFAIAADVRKYSKKA